MPPRWNPAPSSPTLKWVCRRATTRLMQNRNAVWAEQSWTCVPRIGYEEGGGTGTSNTASGNPAATAIGVVVMVVAVVEVGMKSV